MNGVIIPKRSSKTIQLVLAHDGVEVVRPHHVPEDPPGHRDHPHHDEHHGQDVVNKITTKLTEAASSIIATCLTILDTSEGLVQDYSDQ